jgi:hypothetical protein
VPGVSVGTIIELAVATALIVGAVVLYRRRGRDDPQHGSQSAVLLLVIGAILMVHGLGLLNYRPSAAEINAQ